MSKAILNSGLMPTRAHVCLWYSTYLPGASLLRPNVNELRTTCECDKILPMTPNGHTPGLQPLTFPCQFDIPVVRTTGPVGDRMQFDQLKRRDFITLLGGTAVALPIAASAQQTPKVLRVGFVGVQPRDAAIYVAFRKRMVELGYREDRYFTFEYIQTPSIDAYARQPVRYRLCFSPSTSIPSKEVTWPAWPDLAATSPESSSTRWNWRQNASNWCVMLCRKRATSGSSINPIGRRRREADHRG